MSGHPTARQSAALSRLTPLTLAQISVGFAAIAAVWLTVASVHGELIALVAAIAVVACGHGGRTLAGRRPPAVVEWGLAGYGLLAELIVYAAIAASAGLHLAGSQPGLAAAVLRGTFVSRLGGAGPDGVWHLAIMAAIVTVLLPMVDLCVHGPSLPGNRLRLLGPPGDIRLPVVCAVCLVFGPRAAFLAVLLLGIAALVTTITDGTRLVRDRGELRGYRGDGRIAVWIGGWVGGRVPPLAPLVVGLLVTGVLTALGMRNLPALLLLTPVEAMLLAAFASWHPHDGPADWVVPPLLHAAEYVFLAEIGFAARVYPPLAFAVVAAVGLRHLDLGYRVRGGFAAGIDRRALGWEGRMILVGIAAAVGVAPVAYGALAIYLWWRVLRDWIVGWSARYPAVSR